MYGEHYSPVLYMILPRNLANGKFGESMRKREQMLIGALDVRNMLVGLAAD